MVLFPVLLVLIFGAVQAALHYHARDIAAGAASEAVIAGSTTTGGEAAARAAASRFIDTAGAGLFTGTSVSVSRSLDTVTVTVTGHSINLLPGVHTPTIRQTVSGPVERTNTTG